VENFQKTIMLHPVFVEGKQILCAARPLPPHQTEPLFVLAAFVIESKHTGEGTKPKSNNQPTNFSINN
jgi:hypothetical protein